MVGASVYRPELVHYQSTRCWCRRYTFTRHTKTRKPPIAKAEIEFLASVNPKEIEARELMNDIRASYEVSRSYDRRNKAVAKARARQNDRALKNSASQGRIQRRKLQSSTKRRTASTVLRNARDYLGMGTDLYR